MNEMLFDKFMSRGYELLTHKERVELYNELFDSALRKAPLGFAKVETKINQVYSSFIGLIELFDLHYDDLKIPVNYYIDENNEIFYNLDNENDFEKLTINSDNESKQIYHEFEKLKNDKVGFNDILEFKAKPLMVKNRFSDFITQIKEI